ncbi:MAG: hypothetical protein AAGC68_06245 [Verrucomicrobiota bacterium]
MEKKNRYRNRIRPITLWRMTLGGILVLATGACFVLARNQHVMTGHEIREIEDRITQMDREIEMWELRTAAVIDRQELARRLRWVKSQLIEVDGRKVIEIGGFGEGRSEVASLLQ